MTLFRSSSAASSSPPDLSHIAPTSRHPEKSTPSTWPGIPQRHNYESRVISQRSNTLAARQVIYLDLPGTQMSSTGSATCSAVHPLRQAIHEKLREARRPPTSEEHTS